MTNYENPFLKFEEFDKRVKAGEIISDDTDATATTGDNLITNRTVDQENQGEQHITEE